MALLGLVFSLLPALLPNVAHPGAPPVHTCDRLAVAPRMVAPEHQGGWARRLRSGSAALAAAAALALPSGQARAVEQLARGDEAASVARDAGAAVSSSNRKVTPAFLGFRRRVKNGPIHSRGPRSGDEIDMDKIMSAKDARRFTERSFIFSESLTSKSELAEELEELDMLKEEKKGQLLAQTAISVGGSVGLVVGAVKLLTGVERWMKQMELKDIEEEERLTGQCALPAALHHTARTCFTCFTCTGSLARCACTHVPQRGRIWRAALRPTPAYGPRLRGALSRTVGLSLASPSYLSPAHPTSRTAHPTSRTAHPTSRTAHPTSRQPILPLASPSYLSPAHPTSRPSYLSCLRVGVACRYIGVDASDVEYVIDPKTGKNLTIAGNKKKNATSSDAVAEGDKSPGPWILRVLGLDSATASDDDDFWSPAAAAKSKPKSDGKGKGSGGPQAGGGGSGGGGGGDGTGDGDDDDDGGDDDDSSGVDALDDLLG